MAEELRDARGHRLEWISCIACGKRALVRTGGKGYCTRACGSRVAKRGNSYASKGDAAGYSAAHKRINRLRGKANHCQRCGATKPSQRYEWANLTGNFNDPYDYEAMCVPCHRDYDVACRPRGSAHPNARLDEDSVRLIRERHAGGESMLALAVEFGVSDATIARAVSRVTWKHVH